MKNLTQGNMLKEFLKVRAQMRVYHWQTHSYSRHKGADVFYEKIEDLIDEFIESYQGRYGRIKLGKSNMIKLHDYSDQQILRFLVKFRNFLEKSITLFLEKKSPRPVGLLNLRDEMIASVNKALYLFSLQ